MPTYEYRCPACGVFEVVQRISEESLKQCPTCGQEVKRILSATPFHLKGSGWYKTDYATKSNSDTKSSDTPSSSGGEGKPSSEKSAEGSSSKTESGSGADGAKSNVSSPSSSSSSGNQTT